ncbi:MAG: hypothetical protein ABIH26_15665 [Candidatus Eisenbacteria bacterium]
MSPTWKNFLMILFSVVTGSAGQLVMKHGMNTIGRIHAGELTQKIPAAFMNPYVLGGFGLYGISAIMWMVILSRVNLSFAYPMVSLGYVIVVVSSRYLFNEPVTLMRLAGTFVVCFGVFLISRS